jgi:hypothetical protein
MTGIPSASAILTRSASGRFPSQRGHIVRLPRLQGIEQYHGPIDLAECL